MNYKQDNLELYNEKSIGEIFDIERFAVNDGPGIRTVIFFKGCNLSCVWCANPESQKLEQEIMYWTTRCIGCGTCVRNCPQNALQLTEKGIMRSADCILCGKCTMVCNSLAMTMVGRRVTVGDVLQEINKDEAFYRETGGGVTFSGGEPFCQDEFLLELARACRDKEYNTCIETSGYTSWERIDMVKDYIDIFLYDLKFIDSARHKEYTGVDNRLILQNFDRLVQAGKTIVARVPIISGYNGDKEDLLAIADFLALHNPGCSVDLLPYHELGLSKYRRLQREYNALKAKVPPQAFLVEIKTEFKKRGLNVSIGG